MRLNNNKPYVAKKFHIEIPGRDASGKPSVYKITFGTHYFIWKGKSLIQSCEAMSDSIDRYIKRAESDETSHVYHLCNHIKKTRCGRGYVEVIDNDFSKMATRDGVVSEIIDGYRMLRVEQELLDKAAKDPLCLNNNAHAYQPKWIKQSDIKRFETWYAKKSEKKK